jgi:streptogramin lyase
MIFGIHISVNKFFVKSPPQHLTVVYLIFFFTLSTFYLNAQNEIPIGTWRMHFSYNTINAIAIGNDKIFGAAENSVMVLEKTDNSIDTYSKLNGLTGAGISFINYNQFSDQLLIAYKDGNLDIVKGNAVINFDRLKNSNEISGSKRINHIAFRNSFAYMAADYGLAVFDLKQNEVKETWRDLSATGSNIKIFQSAILGDSIFLATEKGVLAGNLNNNLLDYNNWKRFDQGAFAGNIQFITTFNEKIYAAINNNGLYNYNNGIWTKETFLQNLTFTSLTSASNDLLITEGISLWRLSTGNVLTQISDGSVTKPLFAVQDGNGSIWIGDTSNGLISDANGSFVRYLPNGPTSSSSFRLKYYNKVLYSLPGGYSNSFVALNNNIGFDSFADGLWTNHHSSVHDITDIDFRSGKTYLASFGYGVEEQDAQSIDQIFDENNSTLVNINPPGRFVNVTSIENSSNGLWATNYGTASSLQLLDNDHIWHSFSFPALATRYPVELMVDENNFVWMLLNPLQGGGALVFDPASNQSSYLTDLVGAGGLPSKAVRSIALDRDGYVWVGTDAGVAYFFDSQEVFTTTVDAIKPIFDNRFLLKSEKIKAIAVDGGNRKWMGTENGVWLFNSTGEELIYNFTTDNSPLISNIINDIEINDETGEVFFATDKGIVSYRSGATRSTLSFDGVKIFPNPVTAQFNGTIGISGLATDAVVKITDVSGKIVWQTQANGGTAIWNLQDVHGRKVSTGIYLVFAAAQDAAENVVGKIAIVE